jgi:predicted Zn-dependent peptidase
MQRQLAGVFVLTSCALAAVVARTLPSGVDLLVAHEQIDRPFKWDSDLEARVQALTAAEINAAFRKRIDPGSLSIVKAGDFKPAGAYTDR